jgi:RNA polymerase sigma factor (sigma-70 family)
LVKSDAALVKASRSDAAAFRELYERYARSVYGFHLRRTREPEAAHDLTAETFAQAWFGRKRFRDDAGGSAGPWLYGIARNLLASSVRRRRIESDACAKLGIRDRLDEPVSTAQPDDSWLEGLDEAFEKLPDGQRAAIELRVLDDLDYDRVAAELATTPAAARVRVTRGLGFLRDRLTSTDKEAC